MKILTVAFLALAVSACAARAPKPALFKEPPTASRPAVRRTATPVVLPLPPPLQKREWQGDVVPGEPIATEERDEAPPRS